MTTIAYDGHTLAGDTLCCRGAMKNHVESKIWRLKTPTGDVLFGASGEFQHIILVKTWIEAGQIAADRPKIKEDGMTAILVTSDGCFRMEDQLQPMKVMEPFHAVGNGRDFAIAAMHLGRTARQAVELACVYDAYTGGEVTELRLTSRPVIVEEGSQLHCAIKSGVVY